MAHAVVPSLVQLLHFGQSRDGIMPSLSTSSTVQHGGGNPTMIEMMVRAMATMYRKPTNVSASVLPCSCGCLYNPRLINVHRREEIGTPAVRDSIAVSRSAQPLAGRLGSRVRHALSRCTRLSVSPTKRRGSVLSQICHMNSPYPRPTTITGVPR